MIYYCDSCGDYSLSEPKTQNINDRLWECSLCGDMGIVKAGEPERGILDSAARTRANFQNNRFDDARSSYRPLNYLLDALSEARLFVNVATESFDNFFLGILALKMAEPRMEAKMIVWHPQKMYKDLKRLMEHSHSLKSYQYYDRPLARGLVIETVSEAHQKLIIVDGCIAFKGSANATFDGWTRHGELIEFTTDIEEIRQLNRKFFAAFLARKLRATQPAT